MPTARAYAGNNHAYAGNNDRVLDVARAYAARNVQLNHIRQKISQGANAAAAQVKSAASGVAGAFDGLFE